MSKIANADLIVQRMNLKFADVANALLLLFAGKPKSTTIAFVRLFL
jgi:hypothetical protein